MVVQWKRRKEVCVKNFLLSEISLGIHPKIHKNLLLKIFSVRCRRTYQGIL
jgi:hypothetical protein